ncbi:FAD-dependent oxidoreductase [Chryseobacterium sp. 2TAF14]|uniref:FAD-dependent oxidoreductase n=1 Tax=Chryseobacterium sp. 2TAF14 TaxID=3233007 RepID=UPI003F932845
MFRDGARKSMWQEEIKRFSADEHSINEKTFDAIIVGGGITGVSTALELQKRGKKCLLIEASNIGFGTTGGTTAHLNTFFDITFDEAINDFGEDQAKLLAKVGPEAIEIIEKNISQHQIDCDFEKKTGYIFALDEKQNDKLKKMVEAAGKVSIDMKFFKGVSFPVSFVSVASVPDQGQFHPIKYIKKLADVFISLGGIILENCTCLSHSEEENYITVETSKGIFKAENLVYATHVPPGVNVLHLMAAPYRSYVIAFEIENNKYSEDLMYDLYDPYRYYRTHVINGKNLLIAGGEDHKTGHEEDTGICFSNLENYVRKYFNVGAAVYSWSSQYYEPVDGMPYIGKLPGAKGNVYTATGFRGNGMIFGTISSQVISDLITENKSKYEKLFDPGRIKPVAGFASFVKENAGSAADFIKDKLFKEKISSLAELNDGEAKVVKYEGASYAVYKETEGKTHILKSTCPHTYCDVRWNSAEKSWDCPCHGSRFAINGKLLNAPSTEGLQRIHFNENGEEENI